MSSQNMENQPDRFIIAYIDEVEDERDNFFTDAYNSKRFDQIHLLHPDPDINILIERLLDLQIDALVTDFNLSEAALLNYNGEQLVSAFRDIRSEFPCFIRTSYDQDAFSVTDDVNLVYSKDVAKDESAKRYLFERVVLQIKQHKKRISEWQDELTRLLDKDKTQRTANDIEEILNLDSKIEAYFGKDVALPIQVKKDLFEKEKSLIAEAERLVNDIKHALGE